MENKVPRTYFRRADVEQWGLSEGCPGCWYLKTGQGRQQVRSAAYRKSGEGRLNGSRTTAADERINRFGGRSGEARSQGSWNERHTEEASATCQPESESQKKIALDTEQESTQRPSVSCGGSSASGTPPSTATRTAQDADLSDVTRGRAGRHHWV